MRSLVLLSLAALFSCADVGALVDVEDAGPLNGRDGGHGADASIDAGHDAGVTDAGFDAGAEDAGFDAGSEADAGELDAGPVIPTTYPWTFGPPPPPSDWFDAVPACIDSDWLAKYFHYRRRFRGDGTADFPGFTAIGLGPGHSVPAGVRIPGVDCPTHWLTDGCRQEAIPNAKGNLHYGDTTVWQGWYLATLGTEHKAFKLLGVPTAETERDIFYALTAFNRLDEIAETSFGFPPARDGFFKRDDVPIDFIWKDATKTALRFPRNDGFAGYQCISSGTTCGDQTTRGGYYMSQDQIIEMLPGLASIAKLVPAGTVVDGMDLSLEARTITHRVVNYLRGHNWKIVDPTGESPPNEWGGTALPYSNQIAKGANFITGNTLGVTDYRDALSMSVGATLTAAVDAGWGLQTLNNQAMVLALQTVSGEWSQEKLANRSADWNAPYYPLMNAAIHGLAFPPNVSETEIESMLTSAPCSGPCHGTPGCIERAGWQGEHRFKSPEERGGSTRGLDGEYPGIDYMALHNLYVIAKAGKTEPTWPPPPRCSRRGKLHTWLTTAPVAGDTYDPWDNCNAVDFSNTYCGRTFAGWLDAAYHGTATIHLSGVKLRCEGFTSCVVESSSGGGDGDDLFLGSPGNDSFEGGAGSDCLVGHGGSDTLEGGAGRDELHGGDGNDTICGENCNITDLFGDPDLLFGEEGDDELQGGPSTDALYGGPGHDTMNGNQSFDFMYGDEGNDDMDGDLGPDLMNGGDDDDTMRGGMDDDQMKGGLGRDKLDGAMGDDYLVGGPGDDFLMGGEGKDRLSGDSGNDRLCGGCGEDHLGGGWREDGAAEDDSCLGPAATFCFTNTSNVVESCERTASDNECRDSAFNSW